MNENKITTNDIAPGTRVTMIGELDDFTYWVNHLLEGSKLQEQIQRQKAAGWKYPKTNPRSEFHILKPRIKEGTNQADPNINNLLRYLSEKKTYTDKNGVTRLECVKSGSVPLMGIRQDNGRVKEIRPTGNLESGQTVEVEFQCYGTDKGNNGVSVNTVVFQTEPKIKSSLPDWDRMPQDNTAQTTPAPQAAPQAAQAQFAQAAPQAASVPFAQATPQVDPAQQTVPAGFSPVADEEELPWN